MFIGWLVRKFSLLDRTDKLEEKCSITLTVEIDSVFLDFDIVALAIGLVDLPLMVSQVFLTDGNDWGVPEIVHWS